MNYNDLLKKTYYYEEEDFHKFASHSGSMKKKNEGSGFTGVFQQSTIKFFCFHMRGKSFCYYDKEPVSVLFLGINILLHMSSTLDMVIYIIYLLQR